MIAPGWLDHFIYNEYYKTDEEYVFALAEALREEYLAVVDAGFILQIDDPGLPDWWDMIKPAMSVEDYVGKFAKLRIEALNHALKGIPEDRVRYHLCWGSWHGPHTHDLPFEHIIDLMLQVNAQCYSFEAANVRHEHEWRLWEDVKLPDGKIILPGVVSHATNLVEHPELVADRIMRFASWSAARTSSPAPTAGSAAACTPRSPGPSSARWPRARSSRRRCCGAENSRVGKPAKWRPVFLRCERSMRRRR